MKSNYAANAAADSRRTVLMFVALAVVGVLAPFALYPTFLMKVLCFALFACAFNLLLGYVGLLSFGHAAFFGMGAYVAALFAKYIHPVPLLGLVLGIAAATLLGAICSMTIIRGSDLTRLMVTLGVGLILAELANKLV